MQVYILVQFPYNNTSQVHEYELAFYDKVNREIQNKKINKF